jgi:hypothetical protein
VALLRLSWRLALNRTALLAASPAPAKRTCGGQQKWLLYGYRLAGESWCGAKLLYGVAATAASKK